MNTEIEDIVKSPGSKVYQDIDEYLMNKAFPYIKNLYDFVISCSEANNKSFIILKYLGRPMKRQFRKTQIIYMYRYYISKGLLTRNKKFEDWIKAKGTRSSSGIINITFVFKPDKGSCEMDCDYCPNDPEVTRSYRLDEPAVARANSVKWDPVEQFRSRVSTLHDLGHEITKLEYIIEGGTFHSYSEEYVTEFIRDCYYAANVYMKPDRPRMSLQHEMSINETSECPVIGLTIETRPDMITQKQIKLFRYLGVTRVQIGVQSIYDNILKNLNRKCPTDKTIRGIYLLKQNCFKVDLHWMPDLPGTTPNADMLMFQWICGKNIKESDIDNETRELIGDQGIQILSGNNEIIRGDQFKIYPTMVLPYTRIKEWYYRAKTQGAKVSNVQTDDDKKLYVPYAEIDNGALIDNLMTYILTHCPSEVRINRVVRDFAHHDILGGTTRLDLRNEIACNIHKNGKLQTDIRSREVRSGKIDIPNSKIWIEKYRSSQGDEYFISLENNDKTVLYGFIRLRLNDHFRDVYFDSLRELRCAYIRELHVYGNVVPVGNAYNGCSQHLGIGKFLLHITEMISCQEGFQYMAIISGVGTRQYYRKLGYNLINLFMIKDIRENITQCPESWKTHIPDIINTYNYRTNFLLLLGLYIYLLLIIFYIIKH